MPGERRILTRFDASTAGFDRGTQRMERRLRRFQRTTESRLDRMDRRMAAFGKRFGAALAGALTIAAVRQFSRSVETAINKLDNLAKTADKLGITTDALQELRFAAELSGVEVRTFDLAFQRFTRRTAEAAKGTGEAKDALKQLGIQLRENDGSLRPTEKLFRDVADAISEIQDPAERVRVAFKLFDSEGVAVVNMLQRGSAALDQMRQDAQRLGVVIDEDLIRRTEDARDELSAMQRVIDAELTVALAELAPLLLDISSGLSQVASFAGTAYRGLRRFLGLQFDAIEVPRLTTELSEARAELAKLDEEFRTLATTGQTSLAERLGFPGGEGLSADQLNRKLERFADRRAELVSEIEQLEKDLARSLSGQENVVSEPEPIVAPTGGLGSGGGGGSGAVSAEATSERESALRREIRAIVERTAELQRMIEIQARLDPEMKGYTTALRAAEVEAQLLAKAEAEHVEVTAELAAKIREIAQAYAEAEAAADGLRQKQDEIEEDEGLEQLSDGLGAAIAQADSLTDALERVLRKLLEIALQDAFLSAFTGGSTPEGRGGPLSGVFDNFFGSIFHRGGVVGRTSAPMRALPASTWEGAPRMHSGGIAGLRPNEVPAILEKGEIVVPKNVGAARQAPPVVIGDTVLNVTEPGATQEQLKRLLADHRRETLAEVQRVWMRDPDSFPQS